ncbi:MAG: ImmA/IrrE family metallo-endopeptidase [Sedimentisphaerales bacterium]|nr:ImmA/IrrE family metallo-endopeptidase [Sedimentisphaerales bacterium]
MEPSHVGRYSDAEIERRTMEILSGAFPEGIEIPIDIDRLVYQHNSIDDIVPAELLEDKFKVAAVLISKSNGHFDILVDEDTLDSHYARANFSIAHEFGHVVLHCQICRDCRTVEDAIALNTRIKNAYNFIERNANYFAGAILMPLRTLPEDTAKIYEALVRSFGWDINLIPDKVCSTLARRYEVSIQPMAIRLKELSLNRKIEDALRCRAPYLDP